MTIDESTDVPPSYEIVMGNGFDIPPPPYHTVVDVVIDAKNIESPPECPKYYNAIQYV